MSIAQKLLHEFKAILLVTLFFGCWIAVMILFKQLMLAEYQIEFSGMSKALVGALILSKVVLVLEHVSLGNWVRRQAAWVDVLLRTLLYMLGVLLVLVLEKGFEGRHEYGGFSSAVRTVFELADFNHVLINTLVIGGALLVYNLLAVVRRHLGEGGLVRIFLRPISE